MKILYFHNGSVVLQWNPKSCVTTILPIVKKKFDLLSPLFFFSSVAKQRSWNSEFQKQRTWCRKEQIWNRKWHGNSIRNCEWKCYVPRLSEQEAQSEYGLRRNFDRLNENRWKFVGNKIAGKLRGARGNVRWSCASGFQYSRGSWPTESWGLQKECCYMYICTYTVYIRILNPSRVLKKDLNHSFYSK